MNEFGEFIKAMRRERKKTMRSFCIENNFSPAWLSQIERGVIDPERGEVDELSKALGLGYADHWKLVGLAKEERATNSARQREG